jgi:hypothetical protein
MRSRWGRSRRATKSQWRLDLGWIISGASSAPPRYIKRGRPIWTARSPGTICGGSKRPGSWMCWLSSEIRALASMATASSARVAGQATLAKRWPVSCRVHSMRCSLRSSALPVSTTNTDSCPFDQPCVNILTLPCSCTGQKWRMSVLRYCPNSHKSRAKTR